jgi:hypothetical protein
LLFVAAKVPFDKLRAGSFDKPAAAGKLRAGSFELAQGEAGSNHGPPCRRPLNGEECESFE